MSTFENHQTSQIIILLDNFPDLEEPSYLIHLFTEICIFFADLYYVVIVHKKSVSKLASLCCLNALASQLDTALMGLLSILYIYLLLFEN